MQIAARTIDRERCWLPGIRFEQRELRPADQLPEAAIETYQVFSQMDRRCDKPCIGHGISLELLFKAELPQTRPLGAERREVDTVGREQCIHKCHRVLDGSGFPEDPGTAQASGARSRWQPTPRQFTMIPVICRQSPTRHPGGFSFGSVRYVTVTVSCRCDAKCATLKTANAMALVDALFCTAK